MQDDAWISWLRNAVFPSPPPQPERPMKNISLYQNDDDDDDDERWKGRKFVYQGQKYRDPGPKWTPQQILDWMAEHHFPELQGGSYRSKVGADGKETVYFYGVNEYPEEELCEDGGGI